MPLDEIPLTVWLRMPWHARQRIMAREAAALKAVRLAERCEGTHAGTNRGYYAHRRKGEPPCAACRRGHAAFKRAKYVAHPVAVAGCGTDAAYQRHLARNEAACEPCRVAHAARVREAREVA